VLGIAAAIAASTFYSLGIVYQAIDAKRAPESERLRVALLWGLVRRARWLLGTGLSMLGWPLQLIALLLAPLVVVQPALAVGLVVLLLAAERILGEHAGRNEQLAMLAIAIGVIVIGLCAPPRSTTHTSERLTITIVLAALAAASLLPYILKLFHRSSASATMIGAGLAFAWSALATKLAADDLSHGHLRVAVAWALSTAVASLVGVLSEMSALQSRPAIQVAPVVFVVQTVVPVVLAPLLLGEFFSQTPYGGLPLAAGLAVVLVGAAMLARSPLLLALMAGQRAGETGSAARAPDAAVGEAQALTVDVRVSESSGTTPSPRAASDDTIRSSPRTDASDPSTVTTSTSPARAER
jgi:drug/metabolite transporter (DMT)-like permease